MEDSEILDLYFARSETAITQTDLKYGGYCYKIAYNILTNNEDAEESVSDTYMAAWKAIPPRRPAVLATFLGKITRRFSLNRWKSRNAYKRGGGEITLARDERHFNDILTIQDGKVVAIDYWTNLNLCEDNVILRTSYFPLDVVSDDYDNPRYYSFGRIQEGENGKLYREVFLSLDCDTATREWTMTNEETGEQTPIAKEDIDAFLAQYPKLDIEMKPISEFPME